MVTNKSKFKTTITIKKPVTTAEIKRDEISTAMGTLIASSPFLSNQKKRTEIRKLFK